MYKNSKNTRAWARDRPDRRGKADRAKILVSLASLERFLNSIFLDLTNTDIRDLASLLMADVDPEVIGEWVGGGKEAQERLRKYARHTYRKWFCSRVINK